MRSDHQRISVIEGQLRDANKRRQEADEIYTQVLKLAIGAGMSNTHIARIVGVSETAIRSWRKRHGQD